MRIFPMMIIPVAVYGLLVFGGGVTGHADIAAVLGRGMDFKMFSGDSWHLSLGDMVVLLGLVMLFVEIVKATRTTSREIINHGLAVLTFVIALVLFITVKGFSTSPFFLVLAMTVFDVVAGYTISIVAAEHNLGFNRTGTG